MSILPATEFLSLTESGRRFTATRAVRLGDVDPDSRLRLDATARYLQDVANDDARDSDLPNELGWVVRRTMMRVTTEAVLNEELTLTTWCTGAGRSWAERRTSVVGDAGAVIDAVSLWIQIDVATGRPTRIGDAFDSIYGSAAAGRVVSSRLSLPRLSDSAVPMDWAYRRADLDPFGHVNNAAHWALAEERLQPDKIARIGIGEIEYLAPIGPETEACVFVDGALTWVTVAASVAVAIRWSPEVAR